MGSRGPRSGPEIFGDTTYEGIRSPGQYDGASSRAQKSLPGLGFLFPVGLGWPGDVYGGRANSVLPIRFPSTFVLRLPCRVESGAYGNDKERTDTYDD